VDDAVIRSIARWPDVPAVYGWLSLDRRGNFLIKGERIGNPALREFICRNYGCDRRGCWYFQNGPQRVFVRLAYTPLIVHFDGNQAFDHCGRAFGPQDRAYLDEEGSVLIESAGRIGLVDDRDLARFADIADTLEAISSADVAARYGFVQDPAAAPLS
jgi:hypothetical protein